MTTETPPALPFRAVSEILADLDQHGQEFAVVEAPELGSSFSVRGLSRMESQRIAHLSTNGKTGAVDQAKGDWLMLEAALAEPKLTRQKFDAMRMHPRATPAINRILSKIVELTNGVAPDLGEETDPVSAGERFPERAS